MRHILIVSGIILLVFTGLSAGPAKELTVKDIYTNLRFSRGLPRNLQWLPSGEKFSYTQYNDNGQQQLWVEDAATGEKKMVFSGEDLRYTDEFGHTDTLSLYGYQWLKSGSGFVFSWGGDLFYANRENHQVSALTNTDEKEESWALSPDGNWVSFVRENNLFVVKLKTREEKQVTFDGSKLLLNGQQDYVYQEEFGTRGNYKGYWWSPDSRKIAYYQMNQTEVPTYPIVDYAPVHPSLNIFHYPKAGDLNSIVKISVYDLAANRSIALSLGEITDVYFPRVYWLPDSKTAAVIRLDRLQQNLDFVFCNATTGESKIVLSESDPYWINIGDFVHFLKNKKSFIWGSERSGFRHLYLFNDNGQLQKQLTSGDWAVTSLETVDEENGEVYFISTKKDLLERQLYRINSDGGSLSQITEKPGIHSVTFGPHAKFYFDVYSAPLLPPHASLHKNNGTFLRYRNEDVLDKLKPYHLEEPEYFEVKGDNGISFHASLLKPPDFDPHKKYPVIVDVYGGPHSQSVIKNFTSLWHQLMAQRGFLIFVLDNRGTANRGHSWETAIYRHLGELELQDQLTGVKYLKSLHFVDENRIGIWGWSYGGYMVLYALTHSDQFKVGVAVAPVTDWHYYDTIYTERYMGLPSDNSEGYYNSAPLNFAGNLHGKLLLVHGLADDNVHLQNTVNFIDRLIESDIKFDLIVYPGRRHSIRPVEDRIHLFESITEFFQKNL